MLNGSTPPTHQKLLTVGQLPDALLVAFQTRYLTKVSYQFETVEELQTHGRDILLNSEYHLLLIGDGVQADVRKRIVKAATSQNPHHPTVAVLTNEQSYDDNWLAVSPSANADQLADSLSLSPRKNPALIVAVSSIKGGVGKSTLAANVAIALGKEGAGLNVALLEDDWRTRSVRTMMGITDTRHTSAHLIADIAGVGGVVTPDLIDAYLIEAFGVRCLVGPDSVVSPNNIPASTAKNILAVAGNDLGIDVVVIDAPPDIISTSCFTFGLLTGAANSVTPPLILVPVPPETAQLRSVNDTYTVLTHYGHTPDRIWPVINCYKPTHDPESLRGHETLWREPAGIIEYCPEAQFVGDTGRPLYIEQPHGLWAKHLRKWVFGLASLADTRRAYDGLAQAIVAYKEGE